jgi:RNA polymerase-binding transcription factor DksA
MSDPNDEASEIEMAERHQAIHSASLKAAPETHPDFDGVHCLDCEDEIPAGRLALKKIRCVYCQEALERR